MEILELKVTGMTCGGCENSVKKALGRLDGVIDVSASYLARRVTVSFDPIKTDEARVRDRIHACGFTVED